MGSFLDLWTSMVFWWLFEDLLRFLLDPWTSMGFISWFLKDVLSFSVDLWTSVGSFLALWSSVGFFGDSLSIHWVFLVALQRSVEFLMVL